MLRDLEDVEHFFVFPMNQQNRILGVHIVTKGTVNSVDIRPRETFRSAIMMNATSIILAHNHPKRKTRSVAGRHRDQKATRRSG
ncbi:MAG: hypothetical protein IPI29_08440 [Ignavibacteria bacterium]|nr:hypothetical protein [Ignavibacteria bacterium]